MRMQGVPVITIDGPSGSGKGTLARLLAQHLHWHLLDSGALYRLVALAALRRGLALDDAVALAQLAQGLDAAFDRAGHGAESILLDGEPVGLALRSEDCGVAASRVAALPEVRAALLARQRAFAEPPGLVADGRDMGTVVFADAPLKLYLDASPEARAERRCKQLKQQGQDVSFATLLEQVRERDARDMQRAVSPLHPAADAERLDCSELGIEAVMVWALERVAARLRC